ncbi:MAG: hypothetical protein KF729_38365 [Sandaracinaceae bacterium]|nr:hypothetical protein [Sandaracinaceae bacterium]
MHERPRASLTHPLLLAALAALAFNDHVLKASGAWPALAGKLSDVAGLLVAPTVLAWLLGVGGRRARLACHVAVGAGFAALQHPAVAAALEAALPVRAWADPTDLLALPALAVSFLAFGDAPPRRAWRAAPIGVVALALCAASNVPGGNAPPRYPFPPAGRFETDVYVRNHLAADLPIRVRRVKDDVVLDCDRALADPRAVLTDGQFEDEQGWTVAARDAVPLWDRRNGAMTRECYVVRLRARDREWLVAWRHGEPALREVEVRLEPHESIEPEAMRISEEPRTAPSAPAGVTVRPWQD